jgi:hypothetical protein
MHLQSSLFIAVSLITLGFASKTELDGNLAKKSLTDMKPNLVNSTDAIHDLVPRNPVQAMSCVIIFNCPTAGSSAYMVQFTGRLASSQNGGGTLVFTLGSRLGLTVDPHPTETISVFPETIPIGWIAYNTINVPDGSVCLITWTWSINANMPDPNTLTLTDLQANQVKETCGRPCSGMSNKFCTVNPYSVCD